MNKDCFVHVRLPKEDKARLDEWTRKQEISTSEYVRRLIASSPSMQAGASKLANDGQSN